MRFNYFDNDLAIVIGKYRHGSLNHLITLLLFHLFNTILIVSNFFLLRDGKNYDC